MTNLRKYVTVINVVSSLAFSDSKGNKRKNMEGIRKEDKDRQLYGWVSGWMYGWKGKQQERRK